jgi:hypothetical protein
MTASASRNFSDRVMSSALAAGRAASDEDARRRAGEQLSIRQAPTPLCAAADNREQAFCAGTNHIAPRRGAIATWTLAIAGCAGTRRYARTARPPIGWNCFGVSPGARAAAGTTIKAAEWLAALGWFRKRFFAGLVRCDQIDKAALALAAPDLTRWAETRFIAYI